MICRVCKVPLFACRTWCWLSRITSLALAMMCAGIWAVAKGNREELWNDLGLIPSLGGAGESQCLKEEVVPILSSVQAGLTEGAKGSRWVSTTVMLIGKWNLAPSLGKCPSGVKQEPTEGWAGQGPGKLERLSYSHWKDLGARKGLQSKCTTGEV